MEHYEKMIAKLDSLGVSRRLVEAYVLPDWWTPELCEVEANRSLMEAYIFRALGICLDDLRKADPLPDTEDVALFRRSVGDAWAAPFLAGRAAQIVARRLDCAGDEPLEPLQRKSLYRSLQDCERGGCVVAVSEEIDFDWAQWRSPHGHVLILGAERKIPAKTTIADALRSADEVSVGLAAVSADDFDRWEENRMIRSLLDFALSGADFSESEERLVGILGV